MSAIVGVAGALPAGTVADRDSDRIVAALRAMRVRGSAHVDVLHVDDSSPAISLGVSRHDWEPATRGSRTPGVARHGHLALAADATLYYRAELRRAIGTHPRAGPFDAATDTSTLILAAYERWGEECVHHLEGDFAFILWDARRARLLAARDFAGKRPLFHALVGDSLRLASTARGVLATGDVPRELDLAAVASVAAGLWTHSHQSSFRAIAELPAGHRLTWQPGRAPEITPFWSPPAEILETRQPADAAAEELRALLVAATHERLDDAGPTALSLSGGWDSTAVYASGMHALGNAPGSSRTLHAVSISYPEGDPGREDDLIGAVLARWGAAPNFIPVDEIPMFVDAAEGARARDEPFAHAYEQWNRALSRRARAAGARVILDGVGGDQLFQVTDVFLADLFRRGRWVELARQWRARSGGTGTARDFYRWAVRPALPASMVRGLAAIRRMPAPAHYLDRQAPPWIRTRVLDHLGVLERERNARPALPRPSAVLGETHAFLRFAFFPRIMRLLASYALDEGVELRSPLLDGRVVDFATRRPWSERVDGTETKILLRRAMRGLLPDHVLAPRTHRTGITSAYFLRQLRGPGRPLVEGMLGESRLAALGVVDPARLKHAWEYVLARDDDEVGARLFFTLQAELWLRGQDA